MLNEEFDDYLRSEKDGSFTMVLLKELFCVKCGFKKKLYDEEC